MAQVTSARSPGAVHQVEVRQLFNSLDSSDIAVVCQTKQLIEENLASTKESWLVSGLLDYYLATHSDEALKILAAIREPHDKILLEKMNERMKMFERRLPILRVVLYAAGSEPQWICSIGNTNLFSSILKCLKTDTDVPILMTALTVVSTLLPIMPSFVMQHLQDYFDIFGRLTCFCANKPGTVPDIFVLYLHAAIYAFFHRLYGMYPCNFMAYLKQFISREENNHTYKEVIMPMLKRVQFNPYLLVGSKETEVVASRWLGKQSEDIIAECAMMALDPLEGTAYSEEDIPPFLSFQKQQAVKPKSFHTGTAAAAEGNETALSQGTPDLSLLYQSAKGEQLNSDPKLWWSPSLEIHLSTPPLLHTSTASSQVSTPVTSDSTVFISTPKPTAPVIPEKILFENPSLATTECLAQVHTSGHQFQARIHSGSSESQKQKPLPTDGISSEQQPIPEFSIKTLQNILPEFGSEELDDSCCDGEVAELTQKHSILGDMEDLNVGASGGESSLQLPCEHLPSESVVQFMKELNTIKFESGVNLLLTEDRFRTGSRPSSCPCLPLLEQGRSTFTKDENPSFQNHKLQHKFSTQATRGMQIKSPCVDPDLSSSQHDDHSELEKVFYFLLNPVPFTLCPRCQQPSDGNPTELPGADPKLRVLSPVEVLNHLLHLGAEQHAKVLARIPLTSQTAVSWTHFGGSPPADEVNILRGQVLLMQNQLIYERLRRESFARLARKKQIKSMYVTSLKEQNIAMQDQLRLQEQEIQNLQATIDHLRKDNQHLQEARSNSEHTAQNHLKCALREKEKLQITNEQLNNNLNEMKKLVTEQQKQLQELQQKTFFAEKKMNIMEEQVADKAKLKQQMFLLQKELLLLGELQQQYQEKVEVLQHRNNDKMKQENYITALNAELKELRSLLQQKEVVTDNYKAKNLELDENIKAKDITMSELKKLLEATKTKYSNQVKLAEARYESLVKVRQTYDTCITNLQGEVEELQKKASHSDKIVVIPKSQKEENIKDEETVNALPGLQNPTAIDKYNDSATTDELCQLQDDN